MENTEQEKSDQMDNILEKERLDYIKKILGNKGKVGVSGVNFNSPEGNPSFKGILKDLYSLGYIFHVSKTDSRYRVVVNYSLGGSQNA